MKHLLLLSVLILYLGCSKNPSTEAAQIRAYYEGFKQSDYSKVKSTLSDSLISVAGDFTMRYSRESFYEKFKWDSVFRPQYTLVSINEEGENPIATVTMNSPKLEFLQNNPMTCRYTVYFKEGKIARLVELDCPTANWEMWAKRRDSLVGWTKINHPELGGFINDLTLQGAIDYMNAIDLYKRRKSTVYKD
ncbi:hypothetical protein ACFQZJ_10625 [Maribacter chungangensis]|uniref:Nuclear transport factor 2 family protein n=1 Tax=Maribacter chungangensis TaxID=1069117 RepID=A0ABW3B3M0_9FLAO